MMGYLDKNLIADETIIFRTKKHYIIYSTPMIFLLIALFFSTSNPITNGINHVLQRTVLEHNINRIAALIFLVAAMFWGVRQWILYCTSDYAVTNKRVVIKEGFFDRYLVDTRLASISQVMVEQTLLGQLLDYGTIVIKGFGGNADYFIQIASPNTFQRSVHEQLDKVGR